jgi:hypothetical protein
MLRDPTFVRIFAYSEYYTNLHSQGINILKTSIGALKFLSDLSPKLRSSRSNLFCI